MPVPFKITPLAKATMLEAANLSHPREACGIVIGETAYEVRNCSSRPSEFFVMDMDDLRRLAPLGKPDAIWHSHPSGNPTPSSADIEHHPMGMSMIIIANGEVYDYDYGSSHVLPQG